jgi:hypothetical protein
MLACLKVRKQLTGNKFCKEIMVLTVWTVWSVSFKSVAYFKDIFEVNGNLVDEDVSRSLSYVCMYVFM